MGSRSWRYGVTERPTLLVVGAFLNLLGILLVASPDVVPGAMRFAHRVQPRWREIEDRVRRLLRLPPRGRTYEDAATVNLRMRASGAGEVDFDRNAPLEDQVSFLLRRNVDAQREMNALASRVHALEEAEPMRAAELRAEMGAARSPGTRRCERGVPHCPNPRCGRARRRSRPHYLGGTPLAPARARICYRICHRTEVISGALSSPEGASLSQVGST